MSTQPKPYLSPTEYLEVERRSERKHEYYAGEMFATTGASEEHNLIAGNVLAAIHQQFKGRQCKVYPSDMRVKISASGLYTYPDVVAVCGSASTSEKFHRLRSTFSLLRTGITSSITSSRTTAGGC